MQKSISMSFLFLFLMSLSTPLFANTEESAPNLKLSDPLPANLFVELGKAINPGVVNISTKVRPRVQYYRDPFFDMLEQMYGVRPQPQQPSNKNLPAQPHGLGTGFLIREDGLIVTNNHVIAGADEIDVQVDEKSEKLYRAKVIGSDERTDIALIKIEGKTFPKLNLGSSTNLEVGEWVAAFGNPFGQGHTMTKGIVSAKGRDISEINRFPLIQTDAPINPGNSGGPLVNSKGLVVGVNSAIDPRAQGIGFAIPIDEVKALLPQLEKLGRVKKSYLGVQLMDMNPSAAQQLGLKTTEGAVIGGVATGTPAEKAGLQTYDVIVEFNGKKVHNSNELRDMVAESPSGKAIDLKLIREGETVPMKVTLGDAPTGSVRMQNTRAVGRRGVNDWGFATAELNPQLRQQYDIDEDIKKPMIVEVQPQSPAAEAGLLPGDLILDVNRKEVQTPADVAKNLKKGTNTLRIARQQSILFLALTSK